MQTIASVEALEDFGVLIDGERIRWGVSEKMIRALFSFATMEEPLCTYPADWWQHFKQRWFGVRLQKKFPIKYREVIAMHKFPELSPPDSVLGREFVHLQVVDMDKLQKAINGKRKE